MAKLATISLSGQFFFRHSIFRTLHSHEARRIVSFYFAMLAIITGASSVASATEVLVPPDVADARAVEAFKEYWNAFDEYETKSLSNAEKQFGKAWDSVKQNYRQEKTKISNEQLDSLQKAASKYRKHLDEHGRAENRPYVLMNLAQIQNMIGDHLLDQDPNAGAFAKNDALNLLKDIETNHRDFPLRDQALYLRASILESLDQQDSALTAWQSLAGTASATIYGVHARVAVGDHMFARERNSEAVSSYEKALLLLPDVNVQDPAYEQLRINYRLAWAAYRAADLEKALKATIAILTPSGKMRSIEQREKIQQDGIDLAGDALYENNSFSRTKDVLQRKEISTFGAAIGLRALTRYNANNIHGEATRLGEFLINEFPLAKETPEILQVTADSWDKIGQKPKRVATLERLALLLPAQSLWRSRHKDELAAIDRMQDKARSASIAVALHHYDTGLASGNSKEFMAAAAFFDMLLDNSENAPEANDWRLKRAHCHYFAGSYDEAARLYIDLKTNFKVDAETLQIASFQLVLTHERRWRELFAKAGEKDENPKQADSVKAALADLEKSIDEFAARFPGQSRAIDLLLVGAAANRDNDLYDRASSYWQRALVSQASPAQRAVAIRGLIFASMKNGSPGEVVEAARRFLKLEDWRALGLNLGNELRGVLSVAALDEGRRLNDSGHVLEAGLLLTQIAEEFADIPDRDRIYRDGAYMMAIAGEWANAQKAADNYLKTELRQYRADMLYLLARAHEYQLRLHESARRYRELGENHAKHPRAATSLVRAEKLAAAENDFELAASAAAIQAERASDPKTKLADYQRAVEYLERADNHDKALDLSRRLLRSSTTTAGKLRAQVLVARMTYKTGAEQEALDDLTILVKQIDRQRGRIPNEDWAAIAGEAYVLLGDEARRRFDDFGILERAGNISDKVATKMRFFEDLTQYYDKAAAAGDPDWSARARYHLASSAEALADEIASIPSKTDETLTLKSQSRYNAIVERLQNLARKYYSSNVLAARRDPASYRDDEWIKKSAVRLTGETSDKPETRHKELIPVSVQDNIPSDWSL